MIKAIFLGYIGTLVQESGADMDSFLQRCISNSNIKSADAAIDWWKNNLLSMEQKCIGADYVNQERICLNLLRLAEKEWKLKDNINELQNIMMEFWMYAPLFSDAKKFIENCNKPVFIVTNRNEKYPKVCLKRNDLHVHGIFSADSVRSYKSSSEMFEHALKISGFKADEVLYIGTSLYSDIIGAQSAGIQTILLDRKHTIAKADCKIVSNLQSVMKYL